MIRFFTIIALALLLAYGAAAQEGAPSAKDLVKPVEHRYCSHLGPIDRFEHIRVTAPGTVVEFDGKTLNLLVQDKYQTQATSVEVTPLVRLPMGFAKGYKRGSYSLVFCEQHRFVYEVLDVGVKPR